MPDDVMRLAARDMARSALNEGSKLALDSAIRIVGKLVEEFTVKGHVCEAAGASAAMEMLKRMQIEHFCSAAKEKT